MTLRIEDWAFITTSEFVAPECSTIYMVGVAFGHPDRPDGVKVQTAPVAVSLERFVSFSGKEWKLGEPAEGMTPELLLKRFGEVSVGRMLSGYPIVNHKTEKAMGVEAF